MAGFNFQNMLGQYRGQGPGQTPQPGISDPNASFGQNFRQNMSGGQGVVPSLLGAYLSRRHNQQSNGQMNDMAHQGAMNAIGGPVTPGAAPAVGPAPSTGPADDMLASGVQVVDKPTRVVLGDDGPEAVVPLNSKPGNKISTNALFGPMRSNYRG